MEDIEILNERPLTLTEVRLRLAEVEKQKLMDVPKKLKEYLDIFAQQDAKKNDTLVKELKGLGILRLKDKHIVGIVNIMPKDLDGLKAIFTTENITLRQEDMVKIIEAVKQRS